MKKTIDGKTYRAYEDPLYRGFCTGCAGTQSHKLCSALQDDDTNPCDNVIWITDKINPESEQTELTPFQQQAIIEILKYVLKPDLFSGVLDGGEKFDKSQIAELALEGAVANIKTVYRFNE